MASDITTASSLLEKAPNNGERLTGGNRFTAVLFVEEEGLRWFSSFINRISKRFRKDKGDMHRQVHYLQRPKVLLAVMQMPSSVVRLRTGIRTENSWGVLQFAVRESRLYSQRLEFGGIDDFLHIFLHRRKGRATSRTCVLEVYFY